MYTESYMYSFCPSYTLLSGGGYRHGDVESELDDERSRNRELEKQNTSLKSKVVNVFFNLIHMTVL